MATAFVATGYPPHHYEYSVSVGPGGERFLLPSIIKEAGIVGEVYHLIRQLVPPETWDKLLSQREQYQRDYSEG